LGFFTSFFDKKKALKELKKSITDSINKNNQNILIFVDELDRCRPDYAISYLETIKHIFDIKGLIFTYKKKMSVIVL
jgi:predicted KAP-like P-loop ATPase